MQLVLHMNGACSQKHMDTRRMRRQQGFRRRVNIADRGARQCGNRGVLYPVGNRLHRAEIAYAAYGEPRLDNIHPEPFQRLRHGNLAVQVHAASRRLLAVAQCGVKNPDPPVQSRPLFCFFLSSSFPAGVCTPQALPPRRGL